MKKTSKLIIFIFALCVAAFSTYAVAMAGGDVWTVESNYTSSEKAKEIFAYENPFDYFTVKKNGETVSYSDYKDYIKEEGGVKVYYASSGDELPEAYYEFSKAKGTILYRYYSDVVTDGEYKVVISFKSGEDVPVLADREAYVKVTEYAPEGTLSYDTDAAKIAAAQTAAEKSTAISGTVYTIPKAEMRALVKSEVYSLDDLYVELFVISPISSIPQTATSTKTDGTYPTITLSGSGEYRYYILYGDKVYNEDHRFMMTTKDLFLGIGGWYDDAENLVIPVFSFNYEDAEGLSITASGGGEDGVVNRAYSDITFTIKNGVLAENGITLEYSANSTDGKNGTWAAATENEAEFDATTFSESSITFTPKKVGYFRVKCTAQSTRDDEFKFATAEVNVSKEYTEVELVDTRLRDFFKNNWKSLIFFGLAILSLVGIIVVAFYKPKDGKSKKAEIKEDAEEEKAEEAIEVEEAEEATEEVEETEEVIEQAEEGETAETEEAIEPAEEVETEEAETEEAIEPAEEKAEETEEKPDGAAE